MRGREARIKLESCRGGKGGRDDFLKDWMAQDGGEDGDKGGGDGGEAGQHLALLLLFPLLNSEEGRCGYQP